MRFLPDMLLCFARFFCFILMMGFVLPVSFAQPQDEERGRDEAAAQSDVTVRYVQVCRQHDIECKIEYGEKKVVEEEKSSPPRLYLSERSDVNFVLIISLCLGFIVVLGLWFYFGSGGVLLSRRTTKSKGRAVTPDGWGEARDNFPSGDDFFQRIALMTNRQEALVALLRYCLLYAAKLSDTRLARSDTERAVLRRLPQDLPQRSNLETLLHLTELAHYGGAAVEEQKFVMLLALARDFVRDGQISHA